MNIFIERYLIFWYTLNCKMVFIYNIKKDFKIKGVKMSKGQSNRLTKQQIFKRWEEFKEKQKLEKYNPENIFNKKVEDINNQGFNWLFFYFIIHKINYMEVSNEK